MTTSNIAQLFDLTGKGAIVTGGAMGIGKGIALRLAEAGAGVMITDVDLDTASQTVKEIETSGGTAQAMKADACSMDDARKVTRSTVDAFGSLNILVNNAGVYPWSPVMEITEEMWDKTYDVNLKGVFFYSQATAEEMIRAGRGGKIINIASKDGISPGGNAAASYVSSKGGVIMLTKALALELAPHGILVNAVAPGGIATPGGKGVMRTFRARGVDLEEVGRREKGRTPLGHVGQPDDIAKVVLFVASAAADYMTGSVLVVDGGYLLS
ncbi:SDR family NAD(P)-dependent oxidoreductase [Chloroflexota bacterium]